MATAAANRMKLPTRDARVEPLFHADANPPSQQEAGQVLRTALLGSVLLWAAFPPLNLGWLGWLATIPWIVLVVQQPRISTRGYWAIWLAGFIFWSALLQGLRLAHPALYPGWLVLSAYLAVYLPGFVLLGRTLVHKLRWPVLLVVPLVWTGLEYARAHLFTGLALGSLSHTQADYPLLLQTANLGGAYVPGMAMMFVAAALTLWWPPLGATRRVAAVSSLVAGFVLWAALGYGWLMLSRDEPSQPATPPLRILLVQGCLDTVLDHNPDRPREMLTHYRDLTFKHLAETDTVYDLVVWPESAFAYPDFISAADAKPDPRAGLSPDEFRRNLVACQEEQGELLAHLLAEMNHRSAGKTHFLAGTNTIEYRGGRPRVYNAALLVSPQGKPLERYYKQHLVMFGEYIPVLDWFPWLYDFTPLPGGVTPGRESRFGIVAGVPIGMSICFESTVPHLIRENDRFVSEQTGNRPRLHINLTNDGWFYGSSILELHFQCAVLRAVEGRRPLLIAANTGIGGLIDGRGRVVQRGPHHATALLPCTVAGSDEISLYSIVGDWPVFLCLWGTLLPALWQWRRERKCVEDGS